MQADLNNGKYNGDLTLNVKCICVRLCVLHSFCHLLQLNVKKCSCLLAELLKLRFCLRNPLCSWRKPVETLTCHVKIGLMYFISRNSCKRNSQGHSHDFTFNWWENTKWQTQAKIKTTESLERICKKKYTNVFRDSPIKFYGIVCELINNFLGFVFSFYKLFILLSIKKECF